MSSETGKHFWTVFLLTLVFALGTSLAVFVYRATTQISEALAEEVLEQQRDVAALLLEYDNVMLTLGNLRLTDDSIQAEKLRIALQKSQQQLKKMRSFYSFTRLDGAAKAHAFVKPILDDINQWLSIGFADYSHSHKLVLEISAQRLSDRHSALRAIAEETNLVAAILITEQTDYLNRFRDSLIILLAGFVLLALGILALLTRQRNLQYKIAADRKQHAQRLKDFADTGADWFWEADKKFKLNVLSGHSLTLSHDLTDSVTGLTEITDNPLPSSNELFSQLHWPQDKMHAQHSFVNFESEWIAPNGKMHVISISGKPLIGVHGKFTGYRGIGRNITHRKNMEKELEKANKSLIQAETRGRQQAEAALRVSEAFLRTTLNALPSNIAILDDSGVIIAVNTPWKKFVGDRHPECSIGGIGQGYQSVYDSILTADFAIVSNVIHRISDVLSGLHDSAYYEFPNHLPDQQRWEAIAVNTFETDGKSFAVLVHENITNRKLMEHKDRRLRADLAHISRLTTAGEMASGLAHELNQPLTAITHNCDALLSDISNHPAPDAELSDTINDIYEQAQRAAGIIRSMRQFVRKNSSAAAPININKLVEETNRLTQPEVREHGIKVQLFLKEALPHPIIDPIQIQQVLVNLERNSVEAMTQSHSSIRELEILTSQDNANLIRVTIRDTGPGFADVIKQNMFTPFQTTKADGMGLGLSLSRSIIESHGGRLWLESSDSHQTIIHFTLPITKA